MPQFLTAIAIVVGGLWLIRKYARATPAQSRAFTQKMSGGGLIAIAGWLAMRGMVQYAVPLFLLGLGLAGKSSIFAGGFPGGFKWGGKQSPGMKSKVATSLLSMELDHDSGTMTGVVLSGPFQGKQLSDLREEELQTFHGQCQRASDQSLSLYEAWLDRAKPEWRKAWGNTGGGRAKPSSGAMSREEALAVLGLKQGATEDEIRAAHKRLLKEFHPDKGGTDYLAAKINTAKDTLLGS